MDPAIAEDIRQHLMVALNRYGQACSPRLEGSSILLQIGGTESRAEIGDLAERWESLTEMQQKRHCSNLARQLTQSYRNLGSGPSAQRRSSRVPLLTGCLGLLLIGSFWFSPYGPGSSSTTASSKNIGSASADPAQGQGTALKARDERAERVCNATRLRVLRGATVGPTEIEGWTVSITLLRPHRPQPWQQSAVFLDLSANDYEESRVVWSKAPELSAISGYATGLQLQQTSYPAENPQLDQLRLTLHGGYVKSYFQERQRIHLIRLAHGLAKSFGATQGGLYGRCSGGISHHLGSWFIGSNPGGAAASLLYFMGVTANPAFLPTSLLAPEPGTPVAPAFAFEQLVKLTEALDRGTLANSLGSQDGTVGGRGATADNPTGFTAIQFPFVDSNRALRASRSVFRALKQDQERP